MLTKAVKERRKLNRKRRAIPKGRWRVLRERSIILGNLKIQRNSTSGALSTYYKYKTPEGLTLNIDQSIALKKQYRDEDVAYYKRTRWFESKKDIKRQKVSAKMVYPMAAYAPPRPRGFKQMTLHQMRQRLAMAIKAFKAAGSKQWSAVDSHYTHTPGMWIDDRWVRYEDRVSSPGAPAKDVKEIMDTLIDQRQQAKETFLAEREQPSDPATTPGPVGG